jgi:hypothetical protein
MGKSHLKLVAPTEVNRTVAPTRRQNAELRTWEHPTPEEVGALVERFKEGKSGKFLRKSGRRPRKIGACDHSRVPGMP